MSAKVILTGRRFGKLTVMGDAGSNARGRAMWHCKCDCGTERVVLGNQLLTGNTASCGCSHHKPDKNRKDLTGQVFGRLTVLRPVKRPEKPKIVFWECSCSCGGTKTVRPTDLKRGYTKSCGCLLKDKPVEHGHTRRGNRSRTYGIWAGMKTRCTNPNSTDWHLYGGRGITICERWMEFENFLADMGECPDGLSIERKDSNGNYEKSNCVWATATEQANNQRTNVRITFKGRTQTATQWARELGFGAGTLHARIRNGWEVNEETMTPPCRS